MVTARLLWQTPSLRDAAISALTETLGLEGDGGAPARALAEEVYGSRRPGSPVILQWATPELSIRLHCMRDRRARRYPRHQPQNPPQGQDPEAAIRAADPPRRNSWRPTVLTQNGPN